MASKFKVTKIVAPAVYDIPAPLCREIGRITVRWALFEQIQSAAISIAAALGHTAHEVGRESIRSLSLSQFEAMYGWDSIGRIGRPSLRVQGISMAFGISWEVVGGRTVDWRSAAMLLTQCLPGRLHRCRLKRH